MSNSFYLPIHSMNLAHYLGSGVIVPSIYINNKNADIQDRFKNYILLSSSKFTKDTNCAIEIAIDTNEEAPNKISENFYLLDMPLPISRIKNIYFINEEQKKSTEFNITSGSAFIPNRLLKVSREEYINTKELDNIEYKPSEKNWSEYLKKYDQVMGGFSTMRISKEDFQNYPTHYFSTLGNINSLFTNILDQQNIGIENSFKFAFTNESKFKDFHNTIYSDINYNEVERYAQNDKVKLEVKNGLIQLDKILENTQTYFVAILESYGKGKRKQVDSFISDLSSGKFNVKRKEGLSLIFGLNKGYKAFRNKYKTSNFEIDIKFYLDSRLDYYIIESIFQNVFNSLNNISSFKYIDDLFLNNKKDEVKSSKYVTYQMIDETIIWKQRVISPIEKLLTKISDKVSSWFPSFIEVKKNEIESLFKADIEYFKTELESKYNAELEKNKVEIEKLNSIISVRENTILQLENKSKEVYQLKLEIETLLKADIQNYNTELEKIKVEIEKLNNIISDREIKIEQLENEIMVSSKFKLEKETSLKADLESFKSELDQNRVLIKKLYTTISENEKNENKSTEIVNVSNTDTEKLVKEYMPSVEKIDLVSDNIGTLFPTNIELPNAKLREGELNKMKVDELKLIAKKYNIKKISTLKKDDLINEIRKHESK